MYRVSSRCTHCNDMEIPPSTLISAPDTYLLRSLAKNTAGPAMSSGSATLPNGVLLSKYFSFSAFARSLAASCVRVVPGRRAFTRMPYFPNAQAWEIIMLSTAALVGV